MSKSNIIFISLCYDLPWSLWPPHPGQPTTPSQPWIDCYTVSAYSLKDCQSGIMMWHVRPVVSWCHWLHDWPVQIWIGDTYRLNAGGVITIFQRPLTVSLYSPNGRPFAWQMACHYGCARRLWNRLMVQYFCSVVPPDMTDLGLPT